MRSTWYRLLLILVFSCSDAGSSDNFEKYYVGYAEQFTLSAAGENFNEATNEPKRSMKIGADRDRKQAKDTVVLKTNQEKGLTVSSEISKLQPFGNEIRKYPGFLHSNEFIRSGTDAKRPPFDSGRLKSKRAVTPNYSISSDKYHVNISCHVFFKRSCALPDAAFVFKQLAFNDIEETTANWAGTEDLMELLTFQESDVQNGITAKAVHKSLKEKHRVINVDDEESKCIVKDALAFESSRVTKIWGEHGRGGPVVAGDSSPLREEIDPARALRRRRSPHWSQYKQVIFDTGRLMTKYAKKSRANLGKYIEKIEAEESNGTKLLGERKRCGSQNGDCTPFPHKGHWCHYHYKNHKDRKTHYFRHNKTAKPTKLPHCSSSTTGTSKGITIITTKDDELLEVSPKDAVTPKMRNATTVEDVEGLPRKTGNQSRKIDLQHKINSSSSESAFE
uniref:Elongation factor G n=1 Tax=Lygus hesperus TaxID=30085 RepID=A0A0A9W9W9_LYGHE